MCFEITRAGTGRSLDAARGFRELDGVSCGASGGGVPALDEGGTGGGDATAAEARALGADKATDGDAESFAPEDKAPGGDAPRGPESAFPSFGRSGRTAAPFKRPLDSPGAAAWGSASPDGAGRSRACADAAAPTGAVWVLQAKTHPRTRTPPQALRVIITA